MKKPFISYFIPCLGEVKHSFEQKGLEIKQIVPSLSAEFRLHLNTSCFLFFSSFFFFFFLFRVLHWWITVLVLCSWYITFTICLLQTLGKSVCPTSGCFSMQEKREGIVAAKDIFFDWYSTVGYSWSNEEFGGGRIIEKAGIQRSQRYYFSGKYCWIVNL